ncbi:MAG: NADH-quinone oxidoreductase subunit J [Ardenticatenales bacterium]
MMGPGPLFVIVGALALVTAVGMVLARNMVHSALFMVSHFGLTAILYLLLSAPFLAAAQVIVYAGAIMVLFLFVVMLLGDAESTLSEPIAGHRPASILALLVLGAALVTVASRGVPAAGGGALPEGFGSPGQVGEALYTRWVLPFEIVSVILLVAMVGAVVIAHFRRRAGARP